MKTNTCETGIRRVTRGWPPARRKAQAARIRITRPWLRSTGPRTKAGKKVVSLNAVRHSMYSRAMRELKQALKMQRQFLKMVHVYLQLRKKAPPRRALAISRTLYFPKYPANAYLTPAH